MRGLVWLFMLAATACSRPPVERVALGTVVMQATDVEVTARVFERSSSPLSHGHDSSCEVRLPRDKWWLSVKTFAKGVLTRHDGGEWTEHPMDSRSAALDTAGGLSLEHCVDPSGRRAARRVTTSGPDAIVDPAWRRLDLVDADLLLRLAHPDATNCTSALTLDASVEQ